MDYTARTEEFRSLYYDKVQAEIMGKSEPVQLLMERTYSSACMVLTNIDSISLPELVFHVFFFSRDLHPVEIARLYNEQLGLAKSNPEAFALGLHSFLDKLSEKIRKQHHFPKIAAFIGDSLRACTEMRKVINPMVVNAYINLLLQTLEYLRPQKYDMESCIYGVDTSGNPMGGPYPYPFSDLPSIEIQRMMSKETNDLTWDEYFVMTQKIYAKYGITIRTPHDFEKLERVQRVHINTVASMLPFINEDTWDMAPLTPFESDNAPLANLTYSQFDITPLPRRLQYEQPALPNGKMTAQFEDPLRELRSLSMRDVLRDGKPYILYALEVQGGCFYGYYDIYDCYMYSILREISSPIPIRNFVTLFFALYSSLALPDAKLPDLNSIFKQGGQPLHIWISPDGPQENKPQSSTRQSA